jgi:phosphoribosyl-ATP pyrophosphohydrolase
MQNLVDDAIAFRRATDLPVNDLPTVIPKANMRLHTKLIIEELHLELFPAMEDGDLPAIADGIVDVIYFMMGMAAEYGLPVGEVWKLVQSANMAKVDPTTGKVVRRIDGKILKPEGWVSPDDAIKALVLSRMKG